VVAGYAKICLGVGVEARVRPGERLDIAWGDVLRASGMMGGMVVKRRIVRGRLLEALALIEGAAAGVREVLGAEQQGR
jgi:hypothetical protein